MVRSLDANAVNQVANRYGGEPVTIIDVQWTLNGGWTSYADKDVSSGSTFVPGKIISCGTMEDVVDITSQQMNASSTQQATIVLDDTDGTVKAIMDSTDIHKRNIRIYQWFTGLDYSDRFLIFAGKLNTPIVWSEKDRTVTFDVLSTLEDYEVGFSPEEGQFAFIPDELIGVPWPMNFGNPINAPTVKLDKTQQGILGEAVSMSAITNAAMWGCIQVIVQFCFKYQAYWAFVTGVELIMGLTEAARQSQQISDNFGLTAEQFLTQYQQPLSQVIDGQVAGYKGGFRIIGGFNFPQGTEITLNISGARFDGVMTGEQFTVNSWSPAQQSIPSMFPYVTGFYISQVTGESEFIPSGIVGGNQSDPFFAQAGTQVTLWSNEPIRYIVSIVPGVVVSAAAKANLNGGYQTHLFDVPETLYTVTTEQFGSISAVVLTVFNALSKPMALDVVATSMPYSTSNPIGTLNLRSGQQPGLQLSRYKRYQVTTGMQDDVFVTFESAIGPNVADILEYLILTYSTYTFDVDSFNIVRDRLINYPANFSYAQRTPVMQVLQEIAFQSRCGIYLKNGVFFIQYLPAGPSNDSTITESDILADKSLQISYLPQTEDIWTKMTGTWRAQGAQESPNKIIMRQNIKKYGLNEQDFDYYIYNLADLVIKSMTFWMIRNSNTWKVVNFSTPLTKLGLETYDGVTLDFQKPYVANGPVLGWVQQATYDSSANSIDFQVWTPVRAGEMTPYDFAYPADISTTLFYPTVAEEDDGLAGGAGVGVNAFGNQLANSDVYYQVEYDGDNDPFTLASRRYSDKGSPHPSDKGDKSPGKPSIHIPGPLQGGDEPPPTIPIRGQSIQDPPPIFYIDIRNTKIADSLNNTEALLSTIFQEVSDNKVMLSSTTSVSDGENREVFDFKFDSEGGKWGAGTAFLQDSE